MTARVPASTYRLQVSADFTLYDAARTLPYLHDLGIDWVYLSPLLRAEPGSTHGYDVVDHTVVDPARGGAEGLATLSAEARRLGMGVLVDVVPNHMGVATPHENAWWWDLLAHGPESSYADAFDVDWDAADGRVLLPVVADDDLLADGRIRGLSVVGDELRYHDLRLPLRPDVVSSPAVQPVGTPDPDVLHARQHYRLVSWRRGDRELNYRRFFGVTTLAGIRVEGPAVFDASHRQISRWFEAGLVDGLRIDHPDGLRDPAAYLEALRELTGGAYVVVEKILEPGERLPVSWATAGTTGYDVLGLVDRVLVDPEGQRSLTALETRLRGSVLDWSRVVHHCKRTVADETLHAEVRRLAREIAVSAGSTDDHSPVVDEGADTPVVDEGADTPVVEEGADTPVVDEGVDTPVVEEGVLRPSRNHPTDDRVVDTLAELLARFPVYRSYLPDGRDHLDAAFAVVRRHRPDLGDALDLLAPVLGDPTSPVAQRFQQTSGAVMAKGVEDRAFYRTSRLTSLTEVGGDPADFAVSVDEFHAAMAERRRTWPRSMTATTTHDTKRSEDTRARISVLAEIADIWADTVEVLLRLAPVPDPSFGNLLWQGVVGAWPASRTRLHAFAEKAMRESGEHTSWTDPDPVYERAVHAAVDAAFDDTTVRQVLEGLVERVASPGFSNGLALKLVALTMPGVPDTYQGTELWDRSLVDPDNRRPVDFDARRRVLARVRSGERPALSPHADDHGEAKLLVTQAALTLRRNQPHRFTTYEPVRARGSAADHVLAFDRGGALTVVTRLPVGLAARGWGDTVLPLPDGSWTDLLSGREHAGESAVREMLSDYPVAMLVRAEA